MEEEIKKVFGHCRACHMNCPAYYTVKNGRAVDIEGVPREENGTGIICARGLASIQEEYTPTRVRYPMKRAGKRGEGKWERISWDQATSEIAEKIYEMSQKYGPETFVFPGRTGRQDMGWIAHRIARTVGTPNNYYGPIQVCLLPQIHDQVEFGCCLAQPNGTNPATKLLVTIGQEYDYTEPMIPQFEIMAQGAGMKVINLDPICGPWASKADEWLPIRPGTDLAYFMCVIRHLIKTSTYDEAFTKQWTNAPFLVREDTGGLLRESDILEYGSSERYLFWDTKSDSLKYWDTKEVQWEGGVSGKAHYDMCIENFNANKGSTELSPAVMPDTLDPALFGTYEATTWQRGAKVRCTPAFQLLADNVEEWTPERASEVTWIPVDQIERTLEMIATTHPIDFFQGSQYMSTNASQYFHAVAILRAITGNIEVPGGAPYTQFYPVEPSGFPGEYDISYADGLPMDVKRKRLGYYEHRLGCGMALEEWSTWHPVRPDNADTMLVFPDVGCVLDAAETGRPYPVHGIIAISSNWLLHDPTTARWMRLLEDEEKIQLHVVSELVMTPTAEMADYVVPGTTWLERNYLEFGVARVTPFKNFYSKVVEPLCDIRHDYDFGALLAKKLEALDPKYNHGLLNGSNTKFFAGEYGTFWETDTIDEERDRLCRRFFGKTLEECLEERRVFITGFEPGPASGHHLVAGKVPTDTGKVNVFSTLHHLCGYPPLPVYSEPAESPYSRPDLAKEYPLVLTTGKRQVGFFHSEFRQLPWMREINPTPEVFINAKTAAEYGIKHGDWIWVESSPCGGRAPMNKIMGRASTRLMTLPGLVSYSQHGWWRPEKAATDDLHGAFEWNCEALLETVNSSPETGTMGLRSQLCKIYKASEDDIAAYQPMITREQLEGLMPMTDEEVGK